MTDSPTSLSLTGSAVGGDVVGRDKIVNNIQNIYQRALTAIEQAQQEKAVETQVLAQGVSLFAQRLQERAGDTGEAETGNPYKGLLEYRLGDADIFFGRKQAVAELLDHLERGPLTVIHAESGAGKTSLLQAGLSPQLIAAGHLPLYLRPYNNYPGFIIKRAFISDPGQTPLLASAPLRDFLRQVGGVIGAQTGLYIFLDQFEEFFTQLNAPAREDFAGELAECLNDDSLHVHWLLALRTEYFGNLANLRPRVRNPFENDFRLNRLTRDEAREVVAAPAARRGVTFETGLVDKLLDDLGQKEFAPPQIQLVCSALYDELQPGEAAVTHARYDGEGGAAGILREHLDRVLSRDLPPPERAAARRLLESLISSEQQRIIRTHSQLIAELTARGVTPETLSTILDQLIDSRLLRVHEAGAEGGELSYELAHDYLLGEIKLDPEVQARKASQELLEQEVRAYRKFKTLLTEARLKLIEPYRHDLRFTPEAEELFRLSLEAAEQARADREAKRQKELDDMRALAEAQRRQAEIEKRRAEEAAKNASKLARRNRIITYVGVVAVALLVIASVLYVQSTRARQEADAQRSAAVAANTEAVGQQRTAQANAAAAATAEASAIDQRDNAERQARLAASRQLAAQSLSFADSRLDLALLLGLEANQLSDTFEARSVLLADLLSNPRAVTFLRGHTSEVLGLAFSPTGNLMASASKDNTIILWDMLAHLPLGQPLTAHTDWVYSVAFSPDGKLLASGSNDGAILLWDVAMQRPLGPPLQANPVAQAHTAAVNQVVFSPDGKMLASASQDTNIILWDVATRQPIGEPLRVVTGRVHRVAFSPDGQTLVASSGDRTLSLWDVAIQQPIGERLTVHREAAQGLAFSPDGQLLASGGGEGDLILWDMREARGAGPQRLPFSLKGHTGAILHVAFSPDSKTLVSGSAEGTLIQWPVGKALEGEEPEAAYLTGYARPVLSVAFSSDGQTVASGHADGVIGIWDMAQLGPFGRLLDAHTDTVSSVAFSPDGSVMVSGGWDGRLLWWNTLTDEYTYEPKSDVSPILSAAFSPTGDRVAHGDTTGAIFLWDAASQQRVGDPLLGHTKGVLSLAFSPDGKILASSSSDQTVRLWEAETGRLIVGFTGHPVEVRNVAFSPDGRFLASGGNGANAADNKVIVWDVSRPAQSVTQVATLAIDGSSGVFSLAFSPDGAKLAVGYGNGNIVIWDVATRQADGAPLIAHTRGVTRLAFGLLGNKLTLASAGADGAVVLWDMETHLPVGLPLSIGNGALYAAAFNPVQQTLTAGGQGGALAVWNVNPAFWRRRACDIAARNFTQGEWMQYFADQQLEYRKTCDAWPAGE